MTDSQTAPLLACRDLAVGYGDKAVLSGVDLDFAPGHFVSLLGPNGAGKTTLLRTLSRHLPPVGGRVALTGRPLSEMGAMELARTMAVVLTERVSPPLFSVREFVALGRYPHTDFLGRMGAADHEAVERALAAVHAEELADRPFANLSDGERQKALVARALAQAPRLLLLDEPTAHLDLKHRVEVMAILRDLCRTRGITVVASLHDVDVAAKVSDRVALVKNGGITGWGPPESVLTGRAVSDLYDFRDADFDHRLGSIELRGDGRRGRIFVVAGMGSGAGVYRLLAKRGFAIATGVLHANDLDFYVARSLGADLISQSPMEAVNGAALAEALDRLNDCDAVIDGGFPVGPMNRGNVSLLRRAADRGKTVFSLRNGDGAAPGEEIPPERLVRCPDAAALLEAMEARLHHSDGPKDGPEKRETP